MKRKNRLSERVTHFAREGLIGSAGSSIAVPTLLAVGLGGLGVARYAHEVDAENKAAEDDAASASPSSSPSPPLAPSFNDPILPPAPQYQPNQREVFVREAVHDVALADLLPPVQPVTDIDWLRPASPSASSERAYINELADALPSLPSHSAPPVEAEEIPPPPLDNAELEEQTGMPIDENMMGDAPPDNPGLSGGQSAPPAEMQDEMMAFSPEMSSGTFGGEVAEENWLEVVGTPGVPQSEFANLGILFVPLAVTEEGKLADIIFNDEILDAGGVTMDPHELFEIRNDNELWVIGGHDLSDGYGINQVYLQFYPRANPSLYISTVVYIQDDPDPNAILNPDDGNDEGNGDEMNFEPNDPNDPNGGNMLEPGNEDAYIDEQDYSQPGFEEQEFDYQQGPDII